MNLESIHYSGITSKLNWSIFKLEGNDVLSFLQGQSTNNINLVGENQAQLNCLINIKGKIDAYFIFIQKDGYYLVTPPEFEVDLLQRLEKFIIMEDVIITKINKPISVSIYERCEGIALNLFGADCFLHFEDAPDNQVQLFSYLELLGFPTLDKKALQETMITDTAFINEIVDFKKGCFLGQEIVAKIHQRRGASYFPVLLEGEKPLKDEFKVNNRKGGQYFKTIIFENKNYQLVTLYRDFRVQDKILDIENTKYKVHLFPFLKTKRDERAKELYYKAIDEFKNDNEERAKEILYQVIEIDSSFSDAYESLGVIYGRHEQFDKAVELMQELLKIEPNSVMAHTNLSLFYMKQGKIEEAEEEKSKATVATFHQLGEQAKTKREIEEQKKKEEAEIAKREGMFRQVLEIDEEDTLANYGLGDIALSRGNFEEATKYLEKVLKNDEKYSVAYLALGKAYQKLKNKDKAREIFSKGIEIAAAKGDFMPANQMQSLLNQL